MFINVSHSNSFYFTNASNNDMLIYPETSNQSVHIGITSNAASLLTVNSNMITLNANLVVKGPITTNNNLTYAPVDYGVSNFSIPGSIVGTVTVPTLTTVTAVDISLPNVTSGTLALWLDASKSSSITTSGNNVTGWTDQSANGISFVQATSANQPTLAAISLNSRAGIYFGGSQYMSTPSYTAADFGTNNTIFFVISSYTGGLIMYKGYSDQNYFYDAVKKIWMGDSSTTETSRGGFPSFVGNSCDFSTANTAGSLTYTLVCMQTTALNTINMYLNGVLISNNNRNLSLRSDPGNFMTIGGSINPSTMLSTNFVGYIHEIIHYNASLNSTDINAVNYYLTNKWYTPPIFVPNDKFNIKTEGYLYFDGSISNSINFGNNLAIYTGGIQDSCFEAWIYIIIGPTIGNTIISRVNAAGTALDWYLGLTSANALNGYVNNGTTLYRITHQTPLNNNQWYHIAMTIVSGVLTYYVDGIASTTKQTITGNISYNSNYQTIIGNYNNTAVNASMFNGYITNFRIISGYSPYTTTFTPPTSPLTPAPTGTTALLLQVPQNPGRVLIPKIGGTTQSQAYPPAAMTANITNIQNTSYGAGNYIASSSSENTGYTSWNVFDKNASTFWWTSSGAYSSVNGLYIGLSSTVDNKGSVYLGEWIQIIMPVSICLLSFSIQSDNDTINRTPNSFVILGSYDGKTWYSIYSQSGQTSWSLSQIRTYNNFQVNESYCIYRMIILSINTEGTRVNASFAEWILYGTQESISITSDGEVGLGVTQPIQQLEVAGNAIINGNISANNLGMFRNRIINGSMQVNQRGVTSSNYTGTTSIYVCDRYYLENLNVNANSIINITQNSLISSDTPYQLGFNSSLKITINGNDSGASSRWFGGLCQNIEGYNISDFSFGTVHSSPFTVSGWFRSSMSNSSTVTLATRTFSGATSYTYLTNVNVAGSNNWQYLKTTIPPLVISGSIVTTSNNALQLFLAPTASGGSTNTTNSWIGNATYVSPTTTNWANTVGNWVEFTGIQLEKGTMATPFEFRNQARELKLCQRYYWQQVNTFYVSALSTVDPNPRVWMKFPTNMRVAPTITGTSTSTFFANNITTMGFQCGDSNTAGAYGTIYSIYANAEL